MIDILLAVTYFESNKLLCKWKVLHRTSFHDKGYSPLKALSPATFHYVQTSWQYGEQATAPQRCNASQSMHER